MRMGKVLSGGFVVAVVSLVAAGVLSAATPVSARSEDLLCDVEMNLCTEQECQTWCDLNMGPGTIANCGGVPPNECCRCFL